MEMQAHSGGAQSRCLDALLVALEQTSGRDPWYVSTVQLQLASLPLCVACRKSTTLPLRIDAHTPQYLLAPPAAVPPPVPRDDDNRRHATATQRIDFRTPPLRLAPPAAAPLPVTMGDMDIRRRAYCFASRVPRLRARAVAWHRRSCEEMSRPVHALSEALLLFFGGGFDEDVDEVSWPVGLKVISFGADFDQDVDTVKWPPALEEIGFGYSFDRPLDGVAWPASLRYLTLGYCFNYPIEAVRWPPRLEALKLGSCFNQPVARVAWPTSLQELLFGHCFDQPVAEVAWPVSLEVLKFGWNFNQPLDREWPGSLRHLTLHRGFTRPLHGLGAWMPNLAELELLVDSDDYAASASLAEVAWPASLQKLALPKRLWDKNVASLPEGVELDVFYG